MSEPLAQMTSMLTSQTSSCLGINRGYCFDGDFVHLNADVNLVDADLAAGEVWALQLWASADGFVGNSLSGVKVAELALAALPGDFNVAGCVGALPPAGSAPQVMGLALVSRSGDGRTAVRDLAVFPTAECFVQPSLVGDVSCVVDGGVADIRIASVCNPRSNDNLSGTLALEVWALDAPYAGGAWVGMPVASVILGVLEGGAAWTDCSYSVPAGAPLAGAALTVMLREWTPAGYVTRDYRNLAATVAAPVVEAVAAKPAKAKPAAVKKAATAAPKKAASAVTGKTVAAAAAPAKAAATPAKVAVNSASEAELVAVKGLGETVARAIIAARPFASLDDLSRVKGIGAKLLANIRSQLKV
jgi:DNA uptake protein ComE-like DNA-binding protein